MPAPYSYDLRIKVIEAIDRGMGKTQASKIFNISRNTINLSLNRRKKTYGYRERDEEKRKEFLLKISQKPAEKRVYVDESGIDNREDYGYGWNEKGQRFHDLKSGKRSLYCEYDRCLMPGKTDSTADLGRLL